LFYFSINYFKKNLIKKKLTVSLRLHYTAQDVFRKKPEVKAIQNKVQQIKQSAKIKQASSYQAPTSNILVKTNNKRKLDEAKDEDEIIIDEDLSTIVKTPKFYCDICDIQFRSSNSFSQHKRTQKHIKTKDMQEIIFIIYNESIQRSHFEAITKNQWLSGSVKYK
jgi:hypothetical protein